MTTNEVQFIELSKFFAPHGNLPFYFSKSSCRFAILVFFKKDLQSRVRLLFRVLCAISVRHIIHDNSNRIQNYNNNEYNQNRNRWRAHY